MTFAESIHFLIIMFLPPSDMYILRITQLVGRNLAVQMQLIRPYLGMQMSGLADIWLIGAEEASILWSLIFLERNDLALN